MSLTISSEGSVSCLIVMPASPIPQVPMNLCRNMAPRDCRVVSKPSHTFDPALLEHVLLVCGDGDGVRKARL